MKISTKGTYAVQLMLHLADRGQGGPISLKEVSSTQGISKKYLEQIVPSLVTAKLLKSLRGANGGYQLARPASAISVYDVLAATEGSLSPVDYDAFEPGAPNLDLNMWKGLDAAIRDYLEGISLQDIIDRESLIAADSYSI